MDWLHEIVFKKAKIDTHPLTLFSRVKFLVIL